MSHAHEDVYEDRTDIRAEGALDAGSEAGHNVVAFSVNLCGFFWNKKDYTTKKSGLNTKSRLMHKGDP